MLDWTETAVLGPPPAFPGGEPPDPSRKARAPTADGGQLTAVLLGEPPGPMLLYLEFEPRGLEEGEGPDPRAPTLEEIGDAVRVLSPPGALWGFLGAILARGPEVPHNTGTAVYLQQQGALKGSEAARGLVLPPDQLPTILGG